MMDIDSWDDIDDHLPPGLGDEVFLQSHAGGEAILHQILEGMTPRFNYFILFHFFVYSIAKSPGKGKQEICKHTKTVPNNV
jgi:hypothetical protein